jgi:hypothetical protein
MGWVSVQTDFAHAIVKVLRAAEDFDFHAHEIDRQVAAVNFREAHGVLLGGDDEFRLPFLGAVDDVEDFLLGEAVVVGEPFAVDQFGAQFDQALLEALRLGDAAQSEATRRPFISLQAHLFAGENVLEVKRMMNALDDPAVGL